MMHVFTKELFAFLVLGSLLVTPTQAQSLKPGSVAPPLQIGEWLKGKPVAQFEKGQVYVVEFWATWCVPCRENMPHLTELQKRYPKAKMLGISIQESDLSLVKPFVTKMGAKMGYTVGRDKVNPGGDPSSGFMAKNWFLASGEKGIPVAFVVDQQSRIAWIGHPMYLERPLKAVLNGTWKLAMASQANPEEAEMKTLTLRLIQLMQAGDSSEALKTLNRLEEINPMAESMFGINKVFLLHKLGRSAEAEKTLVNVLSKATSPLEMMVPGMMMRSLPGKIDWTEKEKDLLRTKLRSFESVSTPPDGISAYSLSYFYQEVGDFKKALMFAEQAEKDKSLPPNFATEVKKLVEGLKAKL